MKKQMNYLNRMCVFALGITLTLLLAACNSSDYKKAEVLYSGGQYEEALEIYLNLGDYEDSKEKIQLCEYAIANNLFENEQYSEAALFYERLGEYENSGERLIICNKEVGMQTNADYEFLAALENSVLSRMLHSNDTDLLTLVNTEFAYLSQFEGANFYDKSLAEFAALYLQGLHEQEASLPREEQVEFQIGWQEGLVHRSEALKGLYNEFEFMADNMQFVGTYVMNYEKEKEKLDAYKAIYENIEEQLNSDDFKVDFTFPRYNSGTLKFKLKNDTAYTFSMKFIFSFVSEDGTLFYSSNDYVENVKPENSYVVTTNIDFTNCKSSKYQYTVNYSFVEVQG